MSRTRPARARNWLARSILSGRWIVDFERMKSLTEMRDMILETGMEGGMQEQMDLLEELAASLA